MKIIILLFAVLLIYSCGGFFKIADLRIEGYKYPNNVSKGRQLLQQMGKAHQIQNWEQIKTYNAIFGDEFYGFFGKQAHPFKEQQMRFSLKYIPKTSDGQLEILNGKEKGKIWGIQSWNTYKKDLSGAIIPKKNKDMVFWIPTYQYFIEFPNRIQEATSVDYLGEKTIDGIECQGVIASWNKIEPQKDIDQYIVWIDSKSKRIVKLEYTVRDAFKFLTGGVYFQEYKNFSGVLLPTLMPVESNLKKEGLLHTMSIKSFKANEIAVEDLRPLP